MRSIYMAALAGALVLAACGGDSDGTGPGNGGNGGPAGFSAQVRGDIQGDLTGDAKFGSGEDNDGGAIWAVELSETGGLGGTIQLVRLGNQGFPVGTYNIKDPITHVPSEGDVVAVATDNDNGELLAIFVADGGTMKVTSTSGNRVKGTFSFTAVGVIMDDPETELHVTVTGTFNAEPGTPAIQANAAALRLGH